jgi:hypothetical protein
MKIMELTIEARIELAREALLRRNESASNLMAEPANVSAGEHRNDGVWNNGAPWFNGVWFNGVWLNGTSS